MKNGRESAFENYMVSTFPYLILAPLLVFALVFSGGELKNGSEEMIKRHNYMGRCGFLQTQSKLLKLAGSISQPASFHPKDCLGVKRPQTDKSEVGKGKVTAMMLLKPQQHT